MNSSAGSNPGLGIRLVTLLFLGVMGYLVLCGTPLFAAHHATHGHNAARTGAPLGCVVRDLSAAKQVPTLPQPELVALQIPPVVLPDPWLPQPVLAVATRFADHPPPLTLLLQNVLLLI